MDGCEICNTHGMKGNPVLFLQELGMGPGESNHLYMCQNCLGRREVMSWSTKRQIGEEIMRALDEHQQTHGHYSYLGEPQKIHLVRLRSKWVAQHVRFA